MVKYGIEIFARVKPGKGRLGEYDCEHEDDGYSYVSFNIPKDLARDFINNKKETYKFRFNKAFDREVKQDEIFEHVAKGVIDNVLCGYNGTIFAYGQTGSGKTFTITGGAERYADRGIIPRTLSYMFECFKRNSEYVYTSHVSYLEVYNENGYDLLDPKHEASKLEDLPKITLMEDSDGSISLKNLSLHPANNEEEALNLLFLGDTNRMIAETPMNQASTRSHCIFTIHISSREPGLAKIKHAKLHLVDLAGSERIHKTGVDGTILTEAKYINLSLHYLEQVIVALSEKSRSHIPYRNSLLTSVLRDSLGGNCRTTMIATLSVDRRNIDESISTCRFAQRVAMIKNDAVLNEEIDPKLMIAKLKEEIQQLKDELSLSTGMEYKDELTIDDIERLKCMIETFIEDTDPEAPLSVGGDMRKINLSFKLLKDHVLKAKSANHRSTSRSSQSLQDNSYLSDKNETRKLKELIEQRDNEISILYRFIQQRLSDYNIPSIYDGDVNLGKETTSNANWHCIDTQIYSSALCFDPQISSSALCFDPQISSSVPWTSSMSSIVELDVSSEHLPHENDLSLLRKIDIRSFKSLAQLKFAMEHHTVKQLRDLHRKSRVLLHVNLTNNRHVHEEILSVIEECEVVEKSAARSENVTSKSFSTLIEYGDALKEFQAAHRKLVDITEAKLEAEKNHLSSIEKLERMKKKHHNVIRREFQPRRKRKTSV